MLTVLLLVAVLFSVELEAQPTLFSNAELKLLTEQLHTKVERRPAFQGTAVLLQDQKLLWHAGLGQSDTGQPFDQHSKFFVGSISKTLTAVLVLQQVQNGVLDLQAPVKRYWPDLNQPWANSVRVADLLSHTSGLIGLDMQSQPYSEQHYGQFRYNNLNFQLLGQLLSAITQRSYTDLAEELLQQCQMNDSGFSAQTANRGWVEQQEQLSAIAGFMPAGTEPSGGLIASAVDVAKLPMCMQQQLTKTSLVQMSAKRILRPHRWAEVYYGYGLQITSTPAGVEWSHGGYIPGYVAAFHYFPQHRLTLVVLENQSLDTADFNRAVYYHDSLRASVIRQLSQSH